MGLDYSPSGFQERRGRNRRFSPQNDDGDYAPRWVALDWNNPTSSQQLTKGRDGMSHGDKVPISPGTIQDSKLDCFHNLHVGIQGQYQQGATGQGARWNL